MRRAATFFAVLAAGISILTAEEPRGEYVELHACEVYTGGCTASAQATLGGRSMLRVWHFDSAGDLAGLSAAALEVANANLAVKDTEASHTVVYLPEGASDAQRGEMREWLARSGVDISESRVVPVSYKRDGSVISVAAGDGVSFSTRAIEACDAGSCGEQLWYSPRGRTGSFTVLVNSHSEVVEPAVKLSWKDHGAKSVFYGRFGEPEKAEFTMAALP